MVRKGIVLLVGLGLGAGVWAAQTRACLRLRGRVVTDDVLVQDGKLYVPVSLLADSLKMRVRNTADGCDLIEGGEVPNGPQTRNGYVLETLDVARTTDYRARFGYYDFPASAGRGKELVVVTCRLTNGTGAAQSIDLTNGRDTRLSDGQFRSYPCLRGAGGRVLGGTASILAGADLDFALKFEVPVGFRPSDLVVSVQSAFDRPPTDFRFSLRRD